MKLAAKLTLAICAVIAGALALQVAMLAGSPSPGALIATAAILLVCGALVHAIGARFLGSISDRVASAEAVLRVEHEERAVALAQLRQADRLSTAGKLASGIAHELGTPLNVVSGRAMMIASDRDATPTIVEAARAISGQVATMARSIQRLLGFVRRQESTRADAKLRDVLDHARLLVRPVADRHGVGIVLSDQTEIVAHVDSAKLLQVVTNLIMNSLHAMPGGGTLTLGAHREHVDRPPEPSSGPGPYLCLTVHDQGVGIDMQVLEHIFEPFFTTREDGEAVGLGLTVCHGIVRELGGWIEVESQPGEGSTFAVFLPVEGEK